MTAANWCDLAIILALLVAGLTVAVFLYDLPKDGER